ncbi:sulfotransferase family protein [Actinosynnema sp. NPDC020468]|uniref:sulfotransferase-like domain-containing protein n=1 Tax=Actinosynnema sp. NPDC020468 TaxID=3154488 RepID=UPI0033C543F9
MTDSTPHPRILALWSAPRCRSTAFFRMMAERGDVTPVHEPFSYLAEFGVSEVGGRTARTEAGLTAAIRALAESGPVFFKDTTDERYPGVLADRDFLAADATHTFLIRHPAETIASYHAVNPAPRRDQIGFAAQYELFTAVAEATGRTPLVVDAADLVASAPAVVAAYCAEVGIPYLPEALNWRAESRAEWRPSERWHREASASTGFTAAGGPPRVDVRADPVLRGHLDFHLPYYEELRAHRLVIPDDREKETT